MPGKTTHANAEYRTEGFRSVVLPSAPQRPVRIYLPTDYQPKYAYPLVVLFHAAGESEDDAARLVPLLSRRNYIALSMRGSVPLGLRADGRPTFGWNDKPDVAVQAALAYAASQYSIHPDRLFLIGVGEGATAAYRLAATRSAGVAGVVLLNGVPPTDRLPANDLPVLLAHGAANPVVPLAEARRAAARLRERGTTVRLERYATSQRVHAQMLRDANQWIMTQVIGKLDAGE